MDLGRVFAGVPRVGGRVDGCTHCYSESDLDLLGGDPAEVPDDLASSFARAGVDHWSEDEYGLIWRGLAPRILAVLAELPDDRLLHGLAFARFPTWPDEEQAAVRGALQDIVANALTSGETPYRLDDLIGAAAHVDQDMAPWLAYLDTLGPDFDVAIAGLAEYWANDLGQGGEPMLWWWPEDPAAPIRDWLYSDALHERLTRADARDAKIAIAFM